MKMSPMEQIEQTYRAGSRHPPAYFVWGIFAIWITFFLGQFIELAHMHPLARFAVTLVGTILFFALYLGTAWGIARRMTGDTPTVTRVRWQAWPPIITMFAIGLILTPIAGPGWGGLFIYTTAIVAGSLPIKQAATIVVGLGLFTIAGSWYDGLDWRAILANLFTVLVTGFTTIASMWAFTTNQELRQARQELAQMAVTEERLRFARDLHDLLGHTLSLIALKSELAGRLVERMPERAISEISDIEAAARQALHEVREAVAGYRQPSLVDELAAAQELLAAAGISYARETTGTPRTVRPPVEAMLAWTVREGVTNVIRHSHAAHCTILLDYQPKWVRLTVSDDGQGAPGTTGKNDGTSAGCGPGNGLRGLAERAAMLGGTCEAGRQESGGYRLTVALPLTPAPKPAAMRIREGVGL
jgi:two-component system sensor histidine kinase DesK